MGALPSDPLTIRSSVPGPRWGLRPQTPVTESRYRARHGMGRCLSPQMLRAGTTTVITIHNAKV